MLQYYYRKVAVFPAMENIKAIRPFPYGFYVPGKPDIKRAAYFN